jgi:hypothetical protein
MKLKKTTALNDTKNKKIKQKTNQKYLKLTLKSDLKVGCPIPMDGDCWIRFTDISGGLESDRIVTGGGGGCKNPGLDGGRAVAEL